MSQPKWARKGSKPRLTRGIAYISAVSSEGARCCVTRNTRWPKLNSIGRLRYRWGRRAGSIREHGRAMARVTALLEKLGPLGETLNQPIDTALCRGSRALSVELKREVERVAEARQRRPCLVEQLEQLAPAQHGLEPPPLRFVPQQRKRLLVTTQLALGARCCRARSAASKYAWAASASAPDFSRCSASSSRYSSWLLVSGWLSSHEASRR